MAGLIEGFTGRERLVLKVFFCIGVATAAIMTYVILAYPLSEFDRPGALILKLITTGSTLIVQILTAIAAFVVFAYLLIRWRVNRWLTIPIGALLGIVFGGVSTGLTFGVLAGFAEPSGLIDIPDAFGTWWGAFSSSFFNAGVFGGLTGLIAGIILGPAIGFYLGSRKRIPRD